jgi:hypothetical protein
MDSIFECSEMHLKPLRIFTKARAIGTRPSILLTPEFFSVLKPELFVCYEFVSNNHSNIHFDFDFSQHQELNQIQQTVHQPNNISLNLAKEMTIHLSIQHKIRIQNAIVSRNFNSTKVIRCFKALKRFKTETPFKNHFTE